jgi:GDP-L-fucose synthase
MVGIPTNTFGPGDDFDPVEAHVIPALIARMHEASQTGEPTVTIWGSGAPVREFLYVDDLADACIHVLQNVHDKNIINLAGGLSLTIAELAERIRAVVGYRGRLVFDTSRPDGMPLKALDSSDLLVTGWRPRADFGQSLDATYQWYLNYHEARLAHAG